MNSESKKDEHSVPPDDLLARYKPLAIKAVLAGCAVKPTPWKPAGQVEEYVGPLPEGFHIPPSLDD